MALRVLLADESHTIKKVFQLSLQDYGVEVYSVNSGAEVLSQVSSFSPDVIFADILLQKKNGYEVSEELKGSKHKDIPVVLMWSGFMSIDEKKFSQSKANYELEKPFEMNALRSIVQKCVHKTKTQTLSSYINFPPMPDIQEQTPPTEPKLQQEDFASPPPISTQAQDLTSPPPVSKLEQEEEEDITLEQDFASPPSISPKQAQDLASPPPVSKLEQEEEEEEITLEQDFASPPPVSKLEQETTNLNAQSLFEEESFANFDNEEQTELSELEDFSTNLFETEELQNLKTDEDVSTEPQLETLATTSTSPSSNDDKDSLDELFAEKSLTSPPINVSSIFENKPTPSPQTPENKATPSPQAKSLLSGIDAIQFSGLDKAQIEEIITKEVQKIIKNVVPKLAVKLIDEELRRLLSEE